MLQLLTRVLEQKVNIATETKLGQNLKFWVALLNGFVNENAFCVKHFFVHLVLVGRWVVSKDNGFVSFLDLSLA